MAKKVATKPASSGAKLRLSPTHLKKAKACLEKTGKVKIGFKEISVTKLPRSISPVGVFID